MAKHKHGPRKSVDIITTKQRTIWIIRGMYCLSLASLHPHVFWAGQSNVGLLFTATAEQQAGTHHTDELKYNNIGGLKQDQQENSSSATITIYELICFEEKWIYIYIFCFCNSEMAKVVEAFLKVSIMAVDDLAMPGTRASAAMVLT